MRSADSSSPQVRVLAEHISDHLSVFVVGREPWLIRVHNWFVRQYQHHALIQGHDHETSREDVGEGYTNP